APPTRKKCSSGSRSHLIVAPRAEAPGARATRAPAAILGSTLRGSPRPARGRARADRDDAGPAGRGPPGPLPAIPTAPAAPAGAAAAPAAAAAGAAPVAAVLRLVHAQRALAELAAVQLRDRVLGVVVVHLDEAEAPRAARLAVHDDRRRVHLAEAREQVLQVRVSGRPGEVADVDLLQLETPCPKRAGRNEGERPRTAVARPGMSSASTALAWGAPKRTL